MRNLYLLFIFLFASLMVNGQPVNDRLYIDAKRALKTYNLDPYGNMDKLQLARKQLDELAKKGDQTRNPEVQLLTGEVYMALAEQESTEFTIFNRGGFSSAALTASRAYRNAYTHATRSLDKNDALKGLENLQNLLISSAHYYYSKLDYEKAYPIFEATLETHDLLMENSRKSIILSKDYAMILGATSHTAQQIRNYAAAEKFLNLMIKKGLADGDTYDLLVKVRESAGNKSGAEAILIEGRKRFPENSTLLFTEINWLLQQSKLNEMPPLLKKAIELEPANTSLYSTLGAVYDQLSQRAAAAGKTADADRFFTEAVNYHVLSTEKDPGNYNNWYSAGALYYNKAAMVNRQLNQDNLSAQKEAQIISEMKSLFDKALPFFKKAESLAPADINTLIALKTIFERKNDSALYQEFTKRLKTLEAGGKIEKSYF